MTELQVWVLIHKRPMVQPLFQGFFVQVNTVCYMLSKDYQWGPAEAIYCFQLFYVLRRIHTERITRRNTP